MATRQPGKDAMNTKRREAANESASSRVDQEMVRQVVEKVWDSLDEEASFDDFEQVVLEVNNEISRQLAKKNSNV